jgi:hypothetical protein
LIDRIESTVVTALTKAGVEKEGLFAIEVHGGASRVPAVKAKISEIFGREPTQSLNPDECFASGAGFQAAMLLPRFRVPLKVTDVAPEPITIAYTDTNTGELVAKELFEQFQPIPSTKDVTLKVLGENTIQIGSDQLIGTIKLTTGLDSVVSVKVRIVLTRDAIIEVTSATRRTADSAESSDSVPVPFMYSRAFGLPSDAVRALQDEETMMRAQDEYEERVDITRNELESYLFTLQAGVSGDLSPFFTEEELAKAQIVVARVAEWFSENEFERRPAEEYGNALRSLRECGDAAIQRKRLHESLPEILRGFGDRGKKLITVVEASEATNKAPLIADINGFVGRVEAQLKEVLEVPPWIMPTGDTKAEEERLRALEKRAKKLMTPKPQPPPAPEPTTSGWQTKPASPPEPTNRSPSSEPTNQSTPPEETEAEKIHGSA